jgi:SAM-dependent methyltransferase
VKKTGDSKVRERVLKRWDKDVSIFEQWFEILRGVLPFQGPALCLGARLGCEVSVLRKLGFDAVGVDLVPCLPLVVYGDFHNLRFPSGSFDLVYSNSIDHVYDLKKFLGEASRVCRHVILFHLALCHLGTFESLRVDKVEEVTSLLPEFRVMKSETFGQLSKGLNHVLLLRRGK